MNDFQLTLLPLSSASRSVKTAEIRIAAPKKSIRFSFPFQCESSFLGMFNVKKTAMKAARHIGPWPMKAHLHPIESARKPPSGAPDEAPAAKTMLM